MEIDEIIYKWFEETQSKLAKAKSSSDIVDDFCWRVFAVLKTYCDATLFLLRPEIELKLPAMANLRIMSEMIIKFLWCLNINKNEDIEERIKRWEKTGAKNRRKLVEELLTSKETFDSNAIIKYRKEFEILDAYLKNNVGKELPNVTGEGGLFEQTTNIFNGNICAKAYRQFNPAIHIDTLILTWIVKYNGDSIHYTGDLDEDVELLKTHCLSFVYMVIKVIHLHYKWICDQIEKEYHKSISYYTPKVNDD